MSLFHKKQSRPYDPDKQEPAVRKSICTGEMTVGFIDRETGRFQELMMVQNQKELDQFCRQLGISSIKTIY